MQELSQGNLYTITFNVKNLDGSPKDLTGTLELKYELAKRVNSTTSILTYTLADSELSITDATNGVVTLKLIPPVLDNLKGVYYHEIRQINATSEPTTLHSAKIEIVDRLITD